MKHWVVVVGLLAFWLLMVLYMTHFLPMVLDRTELEKSLKMLDKLNQLNKERIGEMQVLIHKFRKLQSGTFEGLQLELNSTIGNSSLTTVRISMNTSQTKGSEASQSTARRTADPNQSAESADRESAEPSHNAARENAEPSHNAAREIAEPSQNAAIESAEPSQNAAIESAEPSQNAAIESSEPSQSAAGEISESNRSHPEQPDEPSGPALTYEQEHARRKAENTARELWFFLEAQMLKLKQHLGDNDTHLAYLNKSLKGYKRTMLDDFTKLRTANSADVWRAQKSKELGDLVQRRLAYIQNPPNCTQAKRIVCDLSKACGFGCQLHHVTYCMLVAYALQRTLILQSTTWQYNEEGWEAVFQPLSETCVENDNSTELGEAMRNVDMADLFALYNKKILEQAPFIELPQTDNLRPLPEFMPLAVPADLAPELSTFHGDPAVWWIGQIVRYLMRLNDKMAEEVEASKTRLGFTNVIVGVHVRRTDKVESKEAAFHPLEEYMVHVEEYYTQLERTQHVPERRVYLATDEHKVVEEAEREYPNYTFIFDSDASLTAAPGDRSYGGSINGVIKDLYFLSRSDFLVCTFSSQMCRVAYELMQTLHGDASQYYRSLDDSYYYGGQNAHNVKVVESHAAHEQEIELEVGDEVKIAGNHWDGFSEGDNTRTDETGLYPSYKVENIVVAVDMPTYPEVARKRNTPVHTP